MSKPAAIPIFGDAYLADTTHLTTEEHGAYFLLLLAAWRQPDCGLPLDDNKLARVTGLSLRKWKSMKDTILDFWKVNGDRIFQPRLLKEFEYACKKSDTNRKSIAARWAAKNDQANTPDDGTENVTDDVKVDQKSKGFFKNETTLHVDQAIENKQTGLYERIYERNTPPPPPILGSVNLEVSSTSSLSSQTYISSATFENSKLADQVDGQVDGPSDGDDAVDQLLTRPAGKPPAPEFALTEQRPMQSMVNEIVDKWNLIAAERKWRKVRAPVPPTTSRFKLIASRITQFGFDSFIDALRRSYNARAFLEQPDADGPPDWFNLDWMVKNDRNITEILEGKYDEPFKPYPKPGQNNHSAGGTTMRRLSLSDVRNLFGPGAVQQNHPMGSEAQSGQSRLAQPDQ